MLGLFVCTDEYEAIYFAIFMFIFQIISIKRRIKFSFTYGGKLKK